MTLDELIRDRAAKGELIYLSLGHDITNDTWCAVYAPAQMYGNNIARDADPVVACIKAIEMSKTKRASAGVTAAVKPTVPDDARARFLADRADTERKTLSNPSSAPDTLDNWLPRT